MALSHASQRMDWYWYPLNPLWSICTDCGEPATLYLNMGPSNVRTRMRGDQDWFRWWLVTYSVPSHYLNQCWVIVNWNIRNKLQWNFNQNKKIFIHKNASENIFCKTAAILWGGGGGWVKVMAVDNLFYAIMGPLHWEWPVACEVCIAL